MSKRRHFEQDDESADARPGRSLRPRDASTLILVRQDGSEPSFLMGCRHGNHVFMANKFAFPGGGVDRADALIKPHTPYTSGTATRLAHQTRRARLEALGLAAIRETFEETGLRIGAPADPPLPARLRGLGSWAHFRRDGIAPTLHGLDFIARAVTPPGRTRRFDARFFLASAEDIHGDPDDFAGASGELTHLHWAPLSEVHHLDLPYITRVILGFVEERLAAPEKKHPVPYIYVRRGKEVIDTIGEAASP